jgi:hypothetical protein
MEKLRKNEILVLRTCGENGEAHGGFVWPLTVGAVVTAPDWKDTDRCGNGLHGLPWGVGGSGYCSGKTFIVLRVCVDVGGYQHGSGDMMDKCKFREATIEFVGMREDAVTLIVKNAPNGLCINWGTATAGDSGTATAGDSGTATAGDSGTATAGDWGTATAGDRGTAIAGYRGTATAGYRGTATAGNSGTATAGDRGTATAGNSGTATAGNSGTATAGDGGTATAGDWGTAIADYRGSAIAGDWGTATAGDSGTAIAGYRGIFCGGTDSVFICKTFYNNRFFVDMKKIHPDEVGKKFRVTATDNGIVWEEIENAK